MDKTNKKLKTPSSAKLISHYVKNIEFNATSKKPVSHYVKNDEPINHCSRPISHYIRTGQLKNSSASYSSKNELKNRSENTEPESACVENRRVRSRRNYISQIISNDANGAKSENSINQILNENYKENDSNHQMVPLNDSSKEPGRKIQRSKSVLISDYIKNSESCADSSIYLGKSQLISKLIGLEANICPSTCETTTESSELKETELNQSVVNCSKKKPRGNFISYYLQSKSSDDSLASQKSEPDLVQAESSFVKLRRSKLISQYISNENIDWTSAQLVENMEQTKPKSNQASRSRYISSFIKQYEDVSLLADSPHTLNKIIRHNLALRTTNTTRNGRRVFKRNKIQKDKFIKKYIKLDNIVNRLRKTKKLD